MADCMQFLSENRLNGCEIFGHYTIGLATNTQLHMKQRSGNYEELCALIINACILIIKIISSQLCEM